VEVVRSVAEGVWVTRGGATRGAKAGARRAKKRARPWSELVARSGYAAYGLVNVLVGVLSVRAAFGGGGKTAGQEGALQTILLAPLGRGLLGLVALGLLGYATWRLFQGILDPDDEGGDAKGLIKRADHIVNGLFHAALAMSVGRVALGSGGGGAAERTTGPRRSCSSPSAAGWWGSLGPESSPSASSNSTGPTTRNLWRSPSLAR
jgi:Domain of Unknown Function (DUF1206)